MIFKSIKVQLSIFLILFALYLSFIGKDPLFLLSLGVSVIAAIAADSIITYLKSKKIIITESSTVSGLIIGYVISSGEAWWIIALASISAVLSNVLFGAQAFIQNAQVFNILGYLNYFFIFIMLIEPMTTPMARFGKIIFGSGAGALIFILYLLGVKEAELVALACFNLVNKKLLPSI